MRFQGYLLVAIAAVVAASSSACVINREVALSMEYDIPNTITRKGFVYVKKGVEARYEVQGIFPAKLDREKLMANMNVAQAAYSKLWHAAGGLKDNQRFVNVMIEAAFVRVVGFGSKLFLVVHVYADVIQLKDVQPPSPAPSTDPSTAPSGDRAHRSSGRIVRMIAVAIGRARIKKG